MSSYDIYIQILINREKKEAEKLYSCNINYKFNILGNNEDIFLVLRSNEIFVLDTMPQVNLITE